MRFLIFLLFLVSSVTLCAYPDMAPKDFYKHTLNVLLLCDTSNPQTRACHLADMKRMRENVKGIAVQCKLRLRLHVLQGEALTEENIQKWEKGVALTGDPTIIYYTGGEDKEVENESKWPAIQFTKKPRNVWTAETLQKDMNGLTCSIGFSLVICDCYDKVRTLPAHYFDPPSRIRRKGKQKGLSYLFWKHLSAIAISSHEKGESGYGIVQGKDRGGLLTFMVCRSLEGATSRPQFWKVLLPEIEGNCFLFALPESGKALLPIKQQIIFQHEKALHPNSCLAIGG